MPHPKVTHAEITREYLRARALANQRAGYPTPKWIQFAEAVIDMGLSVKLYEARRTVSKYLTVSDDEGRSYKVRFSNHAPIAERERNGDCDFFVGRTNYGVTTTEQALDAVRARFGASAVAGERATIW